VGNPVAHRPCADHCNLCHGGEGTTWVEVEVTPLRGLFERLGRFDKHNFIVTHNHEFAVYALLVEHQLTMDIVHSFQDFPLMCG
jgi:hypothetical protein